MSEMITTTARSINTITAEIIVLTQQAQASALASACQIGKRLIEAKELVGHGEWGDYLKNEVSYSQSTANNFMRLYRELGENPNSQALGNLSPTQALRLLALPEDDREEFVQQNDVSAMSTRELEQAIKDRKAAQEMLAIAQENEEDLRKRISQHEAESASLKKALDKAEKSEAAAKADLQKLRDNPEIPPSLIAKTVDQAKAEAAKEYADKLAAAEADLEEKEEARMGMEKALVETQRQLADMKKANSMNDSNSGAFAVLFDSVQGDFNKLHGYLKKISNADPELGAKLKVAIITLLKRMTSMIEGDAA